MRERWERFRSYIDVSRTRLTELEDLWRGLAEQSADKGNAMELESKPRCLLVFFFLGLKLREANQQQQFNRFVKRMKGL